jgi:hypothetical protein
MHHAMPKRAKSTGPAGESEAAGTAPVERPVRPQHQLSAAC